MLKTQLNRSAPKPPGLLLMFKRRLWNLKQLGQDKLVEQLDRISAALDTGKAAVEAA